MNKQAVEQLLAGVKDGTVSIEQAVDKLGDLPFQDLGFAKVDHHRSLRKGFPEVILGQGKTPEQIDAIAKSLAVHGNTVLITRTEAQVYDLMKDAHEDIQFNEAARTIVINMPAEPSLNGLVAVVSAGTSDQPVTLEARITAEAIGCKVEMVQDVGVAGIHRLLGQMELLKRADVIVVVAGMDGALPSAVSGLVNSPVVAVPTSTGYGASFGGISALLAMLNSCGSGVAVMNIDNGFGAGYFAGLLLKKICS